FLVVIRMWRRVKWILLTTLISFLPSCLAEKKGAPNSLLPSFGGRGACWRMNRIGDSHRKTLKL
ncbi:MAG TPA: hypothetical protein VE110_05970, partial [Gemmatimonadaceae bacterium]|nr:hypothetical protein [Gemmatimonadaceae bacterium]